MQRSIIQPGAARHGGAVIIVVLALLSSLAFLGFFFYSWSDMEANSAVTFSNAPDQEIDSDALHAYFLEQVLVSTPAHAPRSALHGGINGTVADPANPQGATSDKSILAHLVGRITADGRPLDIRSRNGRGIGVYGLTPDGSGNFVAMDADEIGFDYNGDYDGDPFGTTLEAGSTTGTPFRVNSSALANSTGSYAGPFDYFAAPAFFHQPDVDYTYPDINAQFLAYDALVPVDLNLDGVIGPGEQVRVIIPSFFRPQLFPDRRQGAAVNFSTIYTDAGTAGQVLRPHSEHRYPTGQRRYLFNTVTGSTPAQSGDRSRLIGNFPFAVGTNQMGVFSWDRTANPATPPGYELDVDADGDGVLDSIWLDLDHPIINLADGRQAVPMFYAKIIDADALLNVNFHGHDPLITAISNATGTVDTVALIHGLTNGWIHSSNLGLSPSEVNPLPALHADPDSGNYIDTTPAVVQAATTQQRGWYNGGAPGFTRVQMSNTELARLLHGSPHYRFDLAIDNPNPGADIPGRYGEAALIRAALSGGGPLPSAGNTLLDDDGDDNRSSAAVPPGADNPAVFPVNLATGIAHTDSFFNRLTTPLLIPPSVHPLDFTGLGNYGPLSSYYGTPYGYSYRQLGAFGGVRDLAGDSMQPDNPSRWLVYGTDTGTGYQAALWANQDGGIFPILGITPWTRAATPGDLQQSMLFGSFYDGLLNENDEIVAHANFPTAVDAPFPTSEMAGLHLRDAQWKLTGETSRLRQLVNFNFQANRQAAAIRQQFTTDSRDRLEHGHTRPVGPDVPASPRYRQWEFNDVLTDPTSPRFPPAFGGAISSRHEIGPGGNTGNDPFRPVTRRLLTIEENNRTNIGTARVLPGQRLNLNRLLVNFDQYGNPVYRRLIPHPEFDGTESDSNGYLVNATGDVRPQNYANPVYAAPGYFDSNNPGSPLEPDLPAAGGFPPVPFAALSNADPNIQKFAQEAWARYDRQRLARDIYVLLYTLGAPESLDGTSPFNPTTTPYPDNDGDGVPDLPLAMAQFAVNYVDALDQDDVITRFEFDPDLSNGWQFQDVDGNGVADIFVNGVEAQQLAFSEVLLIQQPAQSTDFDNTLHNEESATDDEHRWLYIELRNATPFNVDLRTGTYRIARYAENENARTGSIVPDASSRFTSNTGIADAKSIGPGENFIVACHDGQVTNAGGVPLTSDFYVNIEDDGTSPGLEAVIPDSGTTVPGSGADPITDAAPSPPAPPYADLDLVVTDVMAPGHEQYYDNTPITSGNGVALVERVPSGTATEARFQLRLERRLNLRGAELGESDSTWVEVDRFEVIGQPFLPAGNSQPEMRTAVEALISQERRQTFDRPLNGNEESFVDFTTPTPRKHTMDSREPAKHYGNGIWASVNSGDRTAPFTLWQPHFNRDFSSVYELLSVPVVGPEDLLAGIHDGANRRLTGWADSTAMPPVAFAASGLFQHPDGQTPGIPGDDNRWYRLLEFIELAPRVHDVIRDAQSIRRRTEARLNVNTIRHEHVLAGLIDDDLHLNTAAARPANDRLDPPGSANPRNWFDELLYARDGTDFLTGMPLPGMPGARPFRSLTYVDPQAPAQSVRHTFLRGYHPGRPLDSLGVFEARGSIDADGNTANGEHLIDYHTRNRLLAKVANNSTNRSHVFIMWVGYELFEAHQPNPAMPDVVQIGARIDDIPGHREFVVVDMTRLEEAYVDPNPQDGLPGRFDWRKFIIYRKQIQ